LRRQGLGDAVLRLGQVVARLDEEGKGLVVGTVEEGDGGGAVSHGKASSATRGQAARRTGRFAMDRRANGRGEPRGAVLRFPLASAAAHAPPWTLFSGEFNGFQGRCATLERAAPGAQIGDAAGTPRWVPQPECGVE